MCWEGFEIRSSECPIENRIWVRDGKYIPLEQLSNRMFNVPLAGTIFWTQPITLFPFVAGVVEDYTSDCTFKKGEIVLAPDLDHAVIVAWRSPFDGHTVDAGDIQQSTELLRCQFTGKLVC